MTHTQHFSKQSDPEPKKLGNRPGLAFFHFVIRLGGRKIAYFFLYGVVFFYSVWFPSVKQRTDPYLSRRFPDAGFWGRNFHRYRLILNFGRIMIDKALTGIWGKDAIHASFEDPAAIRKIKSLDSGFILLLSHVGCWQVAMSALAMFNKPVNLVMLRDEKDINKHFFEYGGKGTVLKIIDPEQFLGGTIEMLNVLKNDEILCIMGDRIFKNEELAIEMPFLNGKASFPYSAFKLSSTCQKPVVMLDSYKTGPAAYKISISAPVYVPKKLPRTDDSVRPYVQEYVDSLEVFIRANPYQFFNFFDMWTKRTDRDQDGSIGQQISDDE